MKNLGQTSSPSQALSPHVPIRTMRSVLVSGSSERTHRIWCTVSPRIRPHTRPTRTAPAIPCPRTRADEKPAYSLRVRQMRARRFFRLRDLAGHVGPGPTCGNKQNMRARKPHAALSRMWRKLLLRLAEIHDDIDSDGSRQRFLKARRRTQNPGWCTAGSCSAASRRSRSAGEMEMRAENRYGGMRALFRRMNAGLS